MLVSWLTDRLRLLAGLIAVAALAAPSLDVWAQQGDAPKKPAQQAQQQQKPPAKPRPAPTKPGQSIASKTEALPPSQIGIGTLAKQAFMVDPQTSTVLLFKDADKPMHPSSMAKMMTIYIVFE